MKGWVILDRKRPKEYQLGSGFFYEPGYLIYKKKQDAVDASNVGDTIAQVNIEVTDNQWIMNLADEETY